MIKRLFIGVFVVACVAALAAVWLFSTLDLNLYKEKIQQIVFERTGRTLTIDGPVNVQFFPWAGLQLHDATLANAPGFDEAPFASVSSSDVQLEILPLITGTFNVKWVKLHGLVLNLNVNAEGVANWEDLLNTTTVVETETAEDDVLQAIEAGAPLAAALSVGGIEVTDAQVTWVDEKSFTDFAVAKLNLVTDAIQLGRPFEFTTSFGVSSRSLQASSGMAASGALTIDLTSNSYLLNDLELTTTSEGTALPVDTLEASLSGDVLVNLKAQTFDLTGLKANVEGVPFAGELHGTGIFEAPSFFGEFISDSFNAASLMQSSGVPLPSGFDESLMADTRMAFAFQQTQEQILINGLQLATADAVFNGDFQVSNLAQSPVFSGKLASNEFNPAPWLALLDWRAADPLVLQRAQLTTAIRQSGQILSLNELQLTLDDFSLSGNVEVTDINSSAPPIVFELHGTHLDIERYLPATNITESQASQPAATDPLPVDQLRVADINGTMTLDQVSVAGVTLTEVTLPLVAKQGRVDITEAKAALYGGTLFNSASLDLNTEEPLVKWSSNISAVQSEALLGDFLKSPSPISGTGILNIDVITRGIDQQQWLQEADGAVSLRFTDGAFTGVNIGREIRRAAALLQGESFTRDDNNVTDFTELSISGEINDGVLRSDDLSLKAPLLRVSGEGELNLQDQQVDYNARVLITGNTEGQEGADMTALNGLALPVPVTGTLSELSVDFSRLLIDALSADLSSQLEKLRTSVLSVPQSTLEDTLSAEQQNAETVLQQTAETAEVVLEENKEVVIDQIQEQQQQVEQAVEQQVDDLQRNIEKGISNLLEK
ncbi:MAG: AsmA family protein [Pseudomonadota bacterium]